MEGRRGKKSEEWGRQKSNKMGKASHLEMRTQRPPPLKNRRGKKGHYERAQRHEGEVTGVSGGQRDAPSRLAQPRAAPARQHRDQQDNNHHHAHQLHERKHAAAPRHQPPHRYGVDDIVRQDRPLRSVGERFVRDAVLDEGDGRSKDGRCGGGTRCRAARVWRRSWSVFHSAM